LRLRRDSLLTIAPVVYSRQRPGTRPEPL